MHGDTVWWETCSRRTAWLRVAGSDSCGVILWLHDFEFALSLYQATWERASQRQRGFFGDAKWLWPSNCTPRSFRSGRWGRSQFIVHAMSIHDSFFWQVTYAEAYKNIRAAQLAELKECESSEEPGMVYMVSEPCCIAWYCIWIILYCMVSYLNHIVSYGVVSGPCPVSAIPRLRILIRV